MGVGKVTRVPSLDCMLTSSQGSAVEGLLEEGTRISLKLSALGFL